MAKIADEWANHLASKNDCVMEHRSGEPVNGYTVGENLFWQMNMPPPPVLAEPQTVVQSWASEEPFYDYEGNTCQEGEMCGHYTQLVWADTKEVGCAMQTCDDLGSQVWVCNYHPAGNWVGEWPY